MGKQKYNLIDGFEETAAEMYKSGKTLQEIANIIGTSRKNFKRTWTKKRKTV